MAETRLEQYKAAERRLARDEGRRGFLVHAVITGIVWIVLVAVNLTVADEFPWVAFPIAGMGIGLWFHWHFGVVRADAVVREHQEAIERRLTAA